MLKKGIFTISLDFELHWGIFPTKSVTDYQKNLAGTKAAINATLRLFEERQIHATWATVGFLFFDNKKELQACLPKEEVTYDNKEFNPYPLLDKFPTDYKGEFHFAKALISTIKNTPYQEIGTHTFSHFYCLEDGQNGSQFKADLEAAINIGQQFDLNIKSIVFPRNQFNKKYINICKKLNINYLRSNPTHYMYRSNKKSWEKKWHVRVLRFLDTYVNIAGSQIDLPKEKKGIVEIPASRMLRPFLPKMKWLESLKINRIKKEMTLAAQKNKLYHLWWHPHNFGTNTTENLQQLEQVLAHFEVLKKQYGFQSKNMAEVGNIYTSSNVGKKQLLIV